MNWCIFGHGSGKALGMVGESTNLVQPDIAIIGWIAMKFCTDSHHPQKIILTDFGDPHTFPEASPWEIS